MKLGEFADMVLLEAVARLKKFGKPKTKVLALIQHLSCYEGSVEVVKAAMHFRAH